jgi:hypothetical protein
MKGIVMAVVQSRVSDVSGKVGKDADFVEVVIRSGLDFDKPMKFDALRAEVKDLQGAADYIELEVKDNGDTRSIILTAEQFAKLVGDVEKVKSAARPTRGRPMGWSPAAKS